MRSILFFPIFFIPTQEGRPSISLLSQTPSFSTHPPSLLLPYNRPLTPILCTFSSICFWMDQQHMETFLEQPPPPISDASTSILTMLFGWVYLESSPPHDVAIPLHTALPPRDTSNPPSNPNFTTSSWFFIPHTLLVNLEMEGWSTMPFPLSTSRRRYWSYLDLNLIPSTFLKATFTISVPPYPTNLTNPSEDMITLL